MPFNVVWPKATEAFADWGNQVHRKWFFHKLKNKEEKEEIDENSRYEEDNEEDQHCKRMPWYGKSDWGAPSATKEIEDFIEKVRIDLFGNQNKKTWVSDNLQKEERAALKNFRKWNREGSDKIIRIQDKGTWLVTDSKERIIQGTKKILNNGKTFRKEKDNPMKDHIKKVKEWRDKWIEVSDHDEAIWLLNNEAKPATIYANLKTHKDGWPLRHIISCCGTAIENVAKWVEVHLRHLAKIHPTYIEDTRHFLDRIKQINEKYAPLPPTTLLISWDIENFYPSCDTEKVIEAARKCLKERVSTFPPTGCIIEAIKIVMSSNNCEFQEKNYTQINGATIAGPESASTTDIFRAVFIDEPALKEGRFKPLEVCVYRDDMFDVGITKTKEEINAFTDVLNELIAGIRFTPKIRENTIDFLDTTVTVESGYLITSPYSKPTDSKQYLIPSSVHKENIVNNIPKTVGIRLRRLCLDRVEGDRILQMP